MILSMTGFAATSAELPGASLVAELRSVNHRYLDLSIRLPDELRSLEPALREKLSGQLRRGKVELRLGLNRSTPGAASLAVDPGRVAALAAAAARAATRPGSTARPEAPGAVRLRPSLSSTLPRRSWPASFSRSAGSRILNSSESRSERSR